MTKPSRWITLALGAALLASLACSAVTNFALPGPATATPSPAPTAASAERHLEVIAAIDQAVRANYVRADLGGADWTAAVEQARARADAGLDEAGLADAVRALLAALPEGGAIYQTRAERIEAESTDLNSYQGIGVFYGFRTEPQPRVVVLSVIADSPAEEAGLKAHDAIYAIDGEPIRADERATVAGRIRGPAGTSVTLTVVSPGQPRRDIVIPRGSITASDPLRGGAVTPGVIYYRLPVVADETLAETLAQDLLSAEAAPQGLILDLRVASSSNAWPLEGMLALFSEGAFGEFYTRTATQTLEIQGMNAPGLSDVPLAILVGPDTAGLPEVFAACLQANGRAAIVGLATAGDIAGFSAFDLPDGSRLHLATSAFRLANGADLSATGLTPDVVITDDWDSFASAQDDPLIEAVLERFNAP
jgi:carboxyl-terminal processing protease